MPTAEKVKTYKLIARGRNERLIRQPLNHIITATGSKMRVTEGYNYNFAPTGTLELHDGQDMLADGPPGEDGKATEQDAITWLTQGYQHRDGSYGPHPLFNQRVWIEGLEPDRPLPTDADFMSQVTAAVSGLQEEPIRDLLDAELATHNRKVLVAVAENALAQVQDMKASLAAQAPQEPPA